MMIERQSNEKELAKKAARDELWRRGLLSFKLDSTQKELYELFYNSKHKIMTWLLSRRQGKCLKKGTLIMSPEGPKPIEDFKIGDMVYGYNKDGTLSLTPVMDIIYSGTKRVRDIISSNKILAASTDEHKWLWIDYKGDNKEIPLGEVNSLNTTKLARFFIDAPMGDINVSDAYALGALIGDGCSRDNLNGIQLYLSSEDEIIPKAVAASLNCNYLKNTSKNHTWTLTNKKQFDKSKGLYPVTCSYYNDWVKGKYAHEKILDINIVKKWNRESQLKLLAGLIDTDGCIINKENRLKINIGMQAKSVIETIQALFLSLFQYRANINIDNRDKYKNGPLYIVEISSNLFSKRALKELDAYINIKRKKWNPEYEFLPERNNIEDSIGIKLSDYYEAECYDLALNNETHMYATVDGLITHNTYTLVLLAFEQCIRKSNSVVKFVSPTKIQVNNNVRPIIRQLLEDCPEDVKPTFHAKDYIYYFPNGSEIQLAGTDSGHAEKLRGGDSDLFFIDEAGSCDGLDNLVKSILLPTTLITKGKGVLASTPPRESDHEFLKYMEEAELRGSMITKTVNDNPRITKEQLDELIFELGGITSPECRRELFCEIIKDSKTSVVPEFTLELEKKIIRDWPKPPFFDAYEGMDVGGKDLTAVLFGYFDFRADKVIIEDEFIMNFQDPGQRIDTLVKAINKKEKELWKNQISMEYKSPHYRVSDINYILTTEIQNESAKLFPKEERIIFNNARKDDLAASINNLRIMLSNEKIIIHPRCETLLRHLRNVKWDKQKAKFARSIDDSHYDAVAALIYLIRSIEYKRNPYPQGYGYNTRDMFDGYKGTEKINSANNQIEAYKRIFGLSKRKF